MQHANTGEGPGLQPAGAAVPPIAPGDRTGSGGNIAPAPEAPREARSGPLLTGVRSAADIIEREAPPKTDRPSIRRLIRYKNTLRHEAAMLLDEAERIDREIATRSNSS